MPTINRFLVACLTLGLLVPRIGRAQAPTNNQTTPRPLTEAEAVDRALANPDLSDLRAGLVDEAKAEGRTRTTWRNPSFQYTREQLLSGGPLGEDYVTLSQTFDISGRRSLQRKAASARGEAAESRAQITRADLAALTRRSYYHLLLTHQRQAVLTRWQGQVEAQLASAKKRERAGDGAAYDRLRLQRELTRVEALRDRADAMAAAAWTRLRGLIEPHEEPGSLEPPKLEGTLLPNPPKPAMRGGNRELAAPEFEAAQAEARALAFDRRAASRRWVPMPTVGAGYKGVDVPGGGRSHGFVVNVGVPLPIFDRGRAQRSRATARAQSLTARTNLAHTRARAEAGALSEEVTRLSAAARQMRKRNAEDDALTRAAESGYRGGEIGVMELIDAYRSSAEAELAALDLAITARAADINLRRQTEKSP